MMAVPQDEKAQLEAYLIRSQHLATAGKFLWPIPDKGLKKRLHRIKAPTLLLWGTADRLVPPPYAERFAELLTSTRAEVRLIEGGAHMLPYERPAEAAAAIAAFLGG